MKILLATDLAEESIPARDFAAKLVKSCGSKMYLLHMVSPCLIDPPGTSHHEDSFGISLPDIQVQEESLEFTASLLSIADARSKVLGTQISSQWGIQVYAKAEEGTDLIAHILKFCSRHHVDMLVVGNHHHSLLGNLLLGNTTNKFVQHSNIPLLIVPCDKPEA